MPDNGSDLSKKENCHQWSGWPGAYCLKCGAWDPMEQALADNTYDPYEDTWSSEEAKQEAMDALVCPIKGTLNWNDKTKKWDLIKPGEERIVNLGKAYVKVRPVKKE